MKQLFLVLILCGGVLKGNCQKKEKRHHINLELLGGYHIVSKKLNYFSSSFDLYRTILQSVSPELFLWGYKMADAKYKNTLGYGMGLVDIMHLGSKNKHQIHFGFSGYNRRYKAIRTREDIGKIYTTYSDDTTQYKRVFHEIKIDLQASYGFVLKKWTFSSGFKLNLASYYGSKSKTLTEGWVDKRKARRFKNSRLDLEYWWTNKIMYNTNLPLKNTQLFMGIDLEIEDLFSSRYYYPYLGLAIPLVSFGRV